MDPWYTQSNATGVMDSWDASCLNPEKSMAMSSLGCNAF